MSNSLGQHLQSHSSEAPLHKTLGASQKDLSTPKTPVGTWRHRTSGPRSIRVASHPQGLKQLQSMLVQGDPSDVVPTTMDGLLTPPQTFSKNHLSNVKEEKISWQKSPEHLTERNLDLFEQAIEKELQGETLYFKDGLKKLSEADESPSKRYKASAASMIGRNVSAEAEIFNTHREQIKSEKLDPQDFMVNLSTAQTLLGLQPSPSDSASALLSAFVPDQPTDHTRLNQEIFHKVSDFAQNAQKNLLSWMFENQQSKIEKKLEIAEEDPRNPSASKGAMNVMSAWRWRNLEKTKKSFDVNPAKILAEDQELREAYIAHLEKTEQFKALNELSSAAVARNYQVLLQSIRGFFGSHESDGPLLQYQAVPQGMGARWRDFFSLRQEGKALVRKIEGCLDESEKACRSRFRLLSFFEASKLNNQLLSSLFKFDDFSA